MGTEYHILLLLLGHDIITTPEGTSLFPLPQPRACGNHLRVAALCAQGANFTFVDKGSAGVSATHQADQRQNSARVSCCRSPQLEAEKRQGREMLLSPTLCICGKHVAWPPAHLIPLVFQIVFEQQHKGWTDVKRMYECTHSKEKTSN